MPKKYHVEITRSAELDILDIWEYIHRESPFHVDEFVARLEEQQRSLEFFPMRCALIPESTSLGVEYRQILLGDYRSIFRIEGKTVFVLRVIHGSRLLDMG